MPKKTKNKKVFEIYRRKLSEHIVDVPDIYKIRKRPTADVRASFSCWADFRQKTQGFGMITSVFLQQPCHTQILVYKTSYNASFGSEHKEEASCTNLGYSILDIAHQISRYTPWRAYE